MHSSRSNTPTIPTTWSVWISFLAAAAIWAGCVWSYSTNSLTGWPFTPPLAFTHAKYALIMFGPSLKSVPGCLVSIVPMLIGVPVAATPGFGPHFEVFADAVLEPPPLLALVVELEPPLLAAPGAADVVLLLLPQPASAAAPTSAASAINVRRRSTCLYITLTFVLLLLLIRSIRPGLARRGSYSHRELHAMHA